MASPSHTRNTLSSRIAAVQNDAVACTLQAKLRTLDVLKREAVQMINFEIKQIHDTPCTDCSDGTMRVHARFRGITRKVFVQSLSYKLMRENTSVQDPSGYRNSKIDLDRERSSLENQLVNRVSHSRQYYAVSSTMKLNLPPVNTKQRKKIKRVEFDS